jgi:hypothetical protein
VRKPFRTLAILLSAVLAVPALAVVTYDFIYYEPNRSEISRVIARATADERHLPMPLAAFLRWEFRNGTEIYAARLLIGHLGIAQQRVTRRHWSVIYELWIALVKAHLSVEERMTVITVLAPTGTDRSGLSAASLAQFHKPLSELGTGECATLVALISAPSLHQHPEALAFAGESILRRYENGT